MALLSDRDLLLSTDNDFGVGARDGVLPREVRDADC
jgi:hypothetical protein